MVCPPSLPSNSWAEEGWKWRIGPLRDSVLSISRKLSKGEVKGPEGSAPRPSKSTLQPAGATQQDQEPRGNMRSFFWS